MIESASGIVNLVYVGHATTIVTMDGTTIMTDPVLRNRVAHLSRAVPAPDIHTLPTPDAILISHLHLDHCDIPSLKKMGRDVRLIVPQGSSHYLRRRGFTRVEELAPDEAAQVGTVQVIATEAEHAGFRPPKGPTALALGFLLQGSRRVYFAGDTDLFGGMRLLGEALDLALIPIWGWGRKLGAGHLDPTRAAEALRLLQPTIAVPIHWGTLATFSIGQRRENFLSDPPALFLQEAARLAPEVVIEVISPGSAMTLFGD